MRTLIVAEGKHETGGALERIVMRLAPESLKLACEVRRVSEKGVRAFHGKGPGYTKKAIGWLIEAYKKGYEAVVFLIDEDGYAERVQQINDAQKSVLGVSRRAMGVAIRSFDAWMLADEKALTKTLGYPISRQRDPEAIRDPKALCEQFLRESVDTMTQTETYAAVARSVHIETLQERCPRGFAPFADRVRSL